MSKEKSCLNCFAEPNKCYGCGVEAERLRIMKIIGSAYIHERIDEKAHDILKNKIGAKL